MNPRKYGQFNYPEIKFGTNSFWSLLFDVLKGGLVRSTWAKKRREAGFFPPPRISPFCPSFLIIATELLLAAKKVSGQFAVSQVKKIQDKWIPILIANSCPGILSDIELYALKLLKEGCIRDPLFSKTPKCYTPMFPSMLAVFHMTIRPQGFASGIEPEMQNADYLRILLFRIVNLLCSRGLRAADPLLVLEKNNSRQEKLGSPMFKDIRIENDFLQIILIFPDIIVINDHTVGADFDFLWGLVYNHESTTISLDLKWLKNRKSSNFLSNLSFSKSENKDMCLVTHFLRVLNHRLKFYSTFPWFFFFSLPKIARHQFIGPRGVVIRRGEECFVPFTKPRYNEVWRCLISSRGVFTRFCPHDLRRGLQKLLRQIRTFSILNIPEDVANEYGLWKRPRDSQANFYAGQDSFLLDTIYQKVFRWDWDQLGISIPLTLRESLNNCIVRVRVLIFFWSHKLTVPINNRRTTGRKRGRGTSTISPLFFFVFVSFLS